MKRVLLRDRGFFKAREVLIGMLESPPPGGGLSYQDMRRRDRPLIALERTPAGQAHVDLEDADYDVLLAVLNQAQFVTGKRELRLILDDVANAKAPDDTLQLKLIGDEAG